MKLIQIKFYQSLSMDSEDKLHVEVNLWHLVKWPLNPN